MRGGLIFGEGRGRVRQSTARQVGRIARQHGARFHSRVIPGEGSRYWFTLIDGGLAANRLTEQLVRSGLAAAGLDIRRLA